MLSTFQRLELQQNLSLLPTPSTWVLGSPAAWFSEINAHLAMLCYR
jgi:hypothetical protein